MHNYPQIIFSGDMILAAAEMMSPGALPQPTPFNSLIYDGGKMLLNINGVKKTVVVDLAGLSWPSDQNIAIMLNHDYQPISVAGNTNKITTDYRTLSCAGLLYSHCDEYVNRIVQKGRAGFKWKASLGAPMLREEIVPPGRQVVINGQTFTGPFSIARESQLIESSIVVFGASESSSMNIAARKAPGVTDNSNLIILI
ncbi:MAG: hypothetical protein WCV67_03070 [Victivallaceae bacterium]|jgi:hypothetical protein